MEEEQLFAVRVDERSSSTRLEWEIFNGVEEDVEDGSVDAEVNKE